MVKKYVPQKGDIIFIDFNPRRGHEQGGYRPALVISNDVFNEKTHMAMVLPITSNEKYFPTHYTLEHPKEIHGAVLCEHIKSIDYKSRKVKFVEKINKEDLENIIILLNVCIV